MPSVAVISAGANSATVLNEVYSVTFSVDDVKVTRSIKIDWQETFNSLSRSSTSSELRTQIISFIQSKLSKEWTKEAGGFSNGYKKAEENGGTSLIAMMTKYVSTSTSETRDLLRSAHFMDAIKSAFPKERPSWISLKQGEYDFVQTYLTRIEQNLGQ